VIKKLTGGQVSLFGSPGG